MRITLTVIAVLPEILAIVGVMCLRLKKKFLAGIVFAVTVLAALEIIPLRQIFVIADMPSVDPNFVWSKLMKPYGKIDREFEFKRSISTIENLERISRRSPTEKLTRITIYMPDLKNHPDMLIIDTTDAWPIFQLEELSFPNYEKRSFQLDLTIDSDGDGLGDFREAELLSDAYNKDTDGDGIPDNRDSDPLNPFKASDFGEINTAILDTFKTWPVVVGYYLIKNSFYNGRGEFANSNNHVVILDYDQVSKWNVIFGERYTFGQRSLFSQYVGFGNLVFDLSHKIALVGVIQHHGIWMDSSGYLFLFVKLHNKWRIIAVRQAWM